MPELIAPTTALHAAWLAAHREWGPGAHEDGFGLLPTDRPATVAGFAAFVARLEAGADRCTYRWIVDGSDVLGGIALRHSLSGSAAAMGHIGYGIRPSARRRGVGGWALDEMLAHAREVGLDRVLMVCLVDNEASARLIERHGGVLEGVPDVVRRYWITVSA
ncbi:RimJ/RimL family protein N-acetyltransferase [Catenuloplanes nepalensis]|uniref:RimJ/RimL family protein N-acetyltransferase n=1 Tax=Catenuloplanes nepalensis TaxID=587533 RepID=A0ABT9MTT7_9ACTN|nr:GNAT family N-acetyltransferase [Catenuloplanes nepalensis]MDP9794857.1 RimJ/RimL family protein N-acetyltransferase [Catenuloplanes nepalensis]